MAWQHVIKYTTHVANAIMCLKGLKPHKPDLEITKEKKPVLYIHYLSLGYYS